MIKRGGTCGAVACHSPSVDAIFCLVLGWCFGACFSWLKSSLCPKASASLLPTVLSALPEMGGLDVYVEKEKFYITEANL